MFLEATIALLALVTAIFLQPWRLLASQRPLVHESHGKPSALWTPLLAALVVLPWAWALPTLHHMPLQLQWSGACLVLLMLGWPLAVPVLCAVGAIACLLSPALDAPAALSMTLWHGLVPATFALAWGALLRRLLGRRCLLGLRWLIVGRTIASFGRIFLHAMAHAHGRRHVVGDDTGAE